jgi:hypothetical protein
MKPTIILAVLIVLSGAAGAQFKDTARFSDRNLSVATNEKIIRAESPQVDPPAPLKDLHGDLLNDDPVYNKRSDWPVPLYKILIQNIELWAIDRYIFNYDFSRIGFNSWKTNLQQGFAWHDTDRFGIDFWGHPYTGGGYFNAGRSIGWSFYECLPLTIYGSAMWKYFFENDRPSYVDLVNTSISGMLGGEILYRLSSNLLDDRTTGAERFFREALTAVMSPSRFTSRLFQGKLTSSPDQEVYQKEVLNTTVYGGAHLNSNVTPGNSTTSEILGWQFEYGNPFEVRDRKPFDAFKFRLELNAGVGRKILDEVTAYGNLFAGSSSSNLLFTGYQLFDYWDNHTFELGTIGLGPGVITKLPISDNMSLFTTLHLAWVPLAGNSPYGGVSDTSIMRDYNYCGGAEGELETILNFHNIVELSARANYYWMHAYFIHDNNYIGILRPKLTVNIFKDLGIGAEDIIYFNDRYVGGDNPPPDLHSTRSEQKIFLQYYFENSQRGGRFN